MPIKDLLVHIDASKQAATRLTLAATLARRFNAHLTAIYIGAPDVIPATMADQYSREALDAADTRHAVHREAVEALFKSCVPAGEIQRQLIEERGDVLEAVTQYARHYDLTVLGQVDPDAKAIEGALTVPDEVALHSGQPILMVPYAGTFNNVGERVLVAWNGTAQSARAVNDALPFLTHAKKVTILAVGRTGSDEIPTDGIVEHLDRHGIAAEIERLVASESEIGELLLSRAADETDDLMVMGLYSHSRLRERVFGGVSREVLHHMTIPVLMSH